MTYVYVALGAILAGYGVFWLMYRYLPTRLKVDQTRQKADILDDAKKLAAQRKKVELERLADERTILEEQFEAELTQREEDLKITEEDLDARDRSIVLEEARLVKVAKDLENHTAKVEALKANYEEKAKETAVLKAEMMQTLESKANANAKNLSKHLYETLVDSRQMEATRAIKNLDEELSSSAKRLAQRTMARTMARYAPDFYWPKALNTVDVEDRKLFEKLATPEGEPMLAELKEKAEVEVEMLPGQQADHTPLVKLAGGMGVNREAARLALMEMVAKGPSSWGKVGATYDKHRAALEVEAIRLGRIAVRECELDGIHPEIQKLVGYLNWRTSYRQNQWFHTVEVAKLAGLLASELGISPDAGKRCGLLHDIGKALDYKIDGSHAVISGDYADRFGERRLICDTVMSHHNDLVIETPLAYVLRAADTLSGARPGARVNLEEGYQTRLSGIDNAVRSFPGVMGISIMNGGREVHVEVNNKRVGVHEIEKLSQSIARKIEEEVAFPGEIKIVVTRRFEATAVA